MGYENGSSKRSEISYSNMNVEKEGLRGGTVEIYPLFSEKVF